MSGHEYDTPPRRSQSESGDSGDKPDKVQLVNEPVDVTIVGDKTQGRKGQTGDQGDPGRTGMTGATGATGDRGRSLTVWQAMAMFFLILVIGIGLSFFAQRQQARLQQQQTQIARNTLAIQKANYDGCLAGIEIIEQFNRQQTRLWEIDRELSQAPGISEYQLKAATSRMKAYKASIVKLPEGDKPCGEAPR